jgi:uncharacterized membrane protein (GlpM family)
MKWQDVVPVLISIVVIILVAVLQKQSKFASAILSMMPLTAPLALWIVYSLNDGNAEVMGEFSLDLFIGAIPTFGFIVAVWLAARAGLRLGPILLYGYGAWGVVLLLLMGVRRLLGV